MAGIIFDINIWIAYRIKRLPANLIMSVVVMQELVAAATDKTDIRNFKAAKDKKAKCLCLIVPTGGKWDLFSIHICES